MSQTRVFTVPDLGEGLTEATLSEWFVREGDNVTLNQPLCILATAKAEVEIPSPFAGQVQRCHGAAGDTIAVGSPLIEIEPPSELGGPPGDTGTLSEEPQAQTRSEPPAAVLVGYGTGGAPPRRARPAARSKAPAQDSPRAKGAGSAPAPQWAGGAGIRPSGVGAAGSIAAPAAVGALAKPPTRAFARHLGINIATLAPGSGPGGIVTHQDVEAAGRARNGAMSTGAAQSGDDGRIGTPSTAALQTGPNRFDIIPVQGIRAIIAERMTASRKSIPEAWCGIWIDATELVERVERLRAGAETSVATALTPFAVILRFVVAALVQHPILNSTFDDTAKEIRVFKEVHLGVAVADERGLVVAVVRHAERRSTADLAVETRRLIAAVRDGSATPAEVSGSTFTISNFGALGLDDGNPIINAPESAILGIGAIRERPAVIDGQIVVRMTAKLTCAFDHRVCDGAEAAGFLRHLKRLIEDPDRAFIEL
jgi:2-oxoisovalerate dehydrogenase E2 component (dihydrolipoyl transacylase)